jgi:hypothetical protein
MAANSELSWRIVLRSRALLEIAKQVCDAVTPTIYGEIAWDAGLAIRLGRPVRVIGNGNPAHRNVKPAHPAGSKKPRGRTPNCPRRNHESARPPYAQRSRQRLNLRRAIARTTYFMAASYRSAT